jgi:hypothetical protein
VRQPDLVGHDAAERRPAKLLPELFTSTQAYNQRRAGRRPHTFVRMIGVDRFSLCGSRRGGCRKWRICTRADDWTSPPSLWQNVPARVHRRGRARRSTPWATWRSFTSARGGTRMCCIRPGGHRRGHPHVRTDPRWSRSPRAARPSSRTTS